MPEVTVLGAHFTVITIPVHSVDNSALAQAAADIVSDEIRAGTVHPYDDSGRGLPRPPKGPSSLDITGADPCPVFVPKDTTSVFDTAGGTVFGGLAHEQLVVAGEAGFTYFANAGTGTVIAGGGNNFIDIGPFAGSHLVLTDGGNDTINAWSGNDTIAAGGGHNSITLGAGNDSVNVTGHDTIQAGWGADTIGVAVGASAVVWGDCGTLTFIDNGGKATVYGGSGAATLQGGSGHDLFVAGSGPETFAFIDGQAGGSVTIDNFAVGTDVVDLDGYGRKAVTQALKGAKVSHGSTTLTLADNTTITFAGVTHLTSASFT